MLRFLGRVARSEAILSWTGALRHKRFALLEEMVRGFEPPVRILDVGGTDAYWKQQGQEMLEQCQVTVLNAGAHLVGRAGIDSVVGDARDMHQFEDGAFDIVYSNSVIEHVGDNDDQRRMADEVRRVGKAYMVQTPNLYFPIEPHFYFPFYQFLPERVRVELLRHFDLGWFRKTPDRDAATERVRSVRLLSRRDLEGLFPEADIATERLFGLEKSFTAYHRSRS